MAKTALSGKDGQVQNTSGTSMAEITGWTFNKSATTTRFASSESAGYKKSLPGIKHGTGSFTGKLDTVAGASTSAFEVGTQVTLWLLVKSGAKYVVPATITGLSIGLDVDNGQAVTINCTFETDGAWTEPTFS